MSDTRLAAAVRANVGAALIVMALPSVSAAQPAEARIRDAIARGYAAIQVAQKTSRTSQSCTTTCHLQGYGAFAYRAVRGHGIRLDEDLARADFDRGFRRFATGLNAAIEDSALGEVGINEAFFLVAAHEIGLRPSVVTGALARTVALQQTPEGDWTAFHERPPSSQSTFTFTALGLRAIQLYGHPRLKDDVTARVARAKRWLQSHDAIETEDRTYQLLGLAWAGAERPVLSPLAQALAARQRPDGGWNSLGGRESDAYSTGEALVALHEAGGMSTSDPVWRRGADFLLRSQAADGTWHVRTRLPPWVSPPYFESGYPYGRDQFISTAGANWSIRALALALGPGGAVDRLPLGDVAPSSVEPWVETALFGTAAELKQRLDDGLSPNAATATGRTSLLIMAVPDVEKTAMLLDRGADVNGVSVRKYSALTVGAQYPDATPALRLLLARGARAVAPADGTVAADAFPTFFAAHAGNADILPDLRRAGDKLDASAIMFGVFPVTPLAVAAAFGHVAAVRTLLELGASVDPRDAKTDSALGVAVQGNQLEVARLLIARGADVNRPNPEGMTPLMFAAAISVGDDQMLNLLLKSGARVNVRNKDGLTPAEIARKYNHPQLVAKLQPSKSASK